jgi:large subunit ribosomal protein L4
MSIKLNSITLEGQDDGSIDVSEAVFGAEVNRHAIFLALRRERINAMRGTANSKTRAEVSGGGRKPWKQKGTGRARAGSIRSPLWKGGGVIFGPKPRTISISLNRKLVALAHRSALSANIEKMVVLTSTVLDIPKTARVARVISALVSSKKDSVLLIIPGCSDCENLMMAAKNIPNLQVRRDSLFSVHDLLKAKKVIISKDSLKAIEERLA